MEAVSCVIISCRCWCRNFAVILPQRGRTLKKLANNSAIRSLPPATISLFVEQAGFLVEISLKFESGKEL